MVVCAQCGSESPDGKKFCAECGAPLAPVAGVERRERRVVSVLFADLVGFTRLSERLDVEDVEGFLAPYQALLQGCVERTGGVVAKFTGDGVMAVFGGVAAHEDDPERAVRCGLEIRNGLADVEADAGEDRLRVRVGVTTGEALVSQASGGSLDAVGDVVNTAARLESAAPVDGVMVDEWTFHATSRAIRYEPAEPVEAKGKSETVPVWVAVEPVSVVPEQQRDRLPLVGRDAEADMLRDALDRARHEPSTQLVSVIGEPGIGKSRLVDELFDYIDELPDLVTLRRGRSLAYGEGVAFWALGEMVKAQAGILESDSAAVAQEKLSKAVVKVIVDERDREWVARHVRPLVGLETAAGGGEGGRVEAFAAWRRFVEALAEDGPTVLVFDDIHWADDALLDFIDLIADRAGAIPLLIVCTARPELFERREHWGGGKGNATAILLTPLSDGDTARLVGGLLDQALLPAEVQATLLERAEGNPLYAQEYVRMLQDRGVLVRGDGGWVLAGDVVDLPESLQGIIAARLDTLSAEEKGLLQDAAVVGKTAWIGAVNTLSERSTWEAEELLHSLERKQLVQRVRRSSIQGETEFTFGHALTKDVAYSQIRRADRAQKHEAAAAWIERLAGERDDKAELLADHYTQALSLREALGDDTTPIAARARVALSEAAQQAAATYAYAAAARHFEAALKLTSPDDATSRAALLLGLATALHDAGSPNPDVEKAALTAQIAVEAWEAAAQAERLIFNRLEDAGERDQADAHIEHAAAFAARVPPSDTTLLIAYTQAYRLTTSGHPDGALALVGEMIPRAEEAGLEVGRALLLVWRGTARVELGDTDGVADLREAAEVLARHASRQAPLAYGNYADVVRGLGPMRVADDAYAAAAEWSARFGVQYHLDWINFEQAYQAYHAAQWDTSEQLFTRPTVANAWGETYVCMSRGRISAARNDLKHAREDAAVIVDYADNVGRDDFLYIGLALDARCHRAAGNSKDALDACDRFLIRWQETNGFTARSLELCEIAPILVQANRHEEIRSAASVLPDACRWRDALLLTAEQRYADAATRYTEIGSEPLAADAHLLAAHQAADEGHTADAARHADAVLAFAGQTGAVLYQRQAAECAKAASA
jgi:class 3 adenylate cyclase